MRFSTPLFFHHPMTSSYLRLFVPPRLFGLPPTEIIARCGMDGPLRSLQSLCFIIAPLPSASVTQTMHDALLSECTKIAHRRSLAIFIADEGIAGNSAARISFTRFHRRKNRGSLAIFFAEEIAHLGASKSHAISPGAVKIAAATAENRAILVHSASCSFLTPCMIMTFDWASNTWKRGVSAT